MRATIWGARGSLPSFGPENTRYGGNTACLEVRGDADELLVVDAGSGIRPLGESLSSDLRRVNLLLTHLHMDHVLGLGFFAPMYDPDAVVTVWGPGVSPDALRAEINRYLSPPLFPVRLRDLPGSLEFHCVPRGTFEIGPFAIDANYVCHPGPTLGFRISENGASMCFMPDHEPALGAHEFPDDPQWTSGFDLAQGVDVLLHDTQFSASEYRQHVGWGHSSILDAVQFAAAAGVKRMVTFHHDPSHGDAELDHMIAGARELVHPEVMLVPGTEGSTIHIASR
ncbi:MAG: MBL fold metallo-hydrolase [Anaerolineae bacterium]|jgi:phosphoribosyl 1,2-cyclic phosphodiesterase